MIIRPRLIIQVTTATWVAFMGLALYGSAIYSAYERRENLAAGRERDLANGVQSGLDGGAIESPASLSGGQEPPSSPGNPVPHTRGKGGATPPAPGSVRSSSAFRHLTGSLGEGRGSSAQGDLRRMATAAAKRCRVSVALFHRLIARESSFDPRAISKAGARGLTQLLPRYHSHPLLDIDDPLTNLSIGCAYLRRLIDLRRGNVRRALLDYNAGPNRKATTQAHRDYADDIMGSAQ